DVQRQIADYLDSKTAEIDNQISQTQKSIELLQEYRKSVISEAVTKGLDPDVPMKDSGVEWIGEIPEGWFVTKLLYGLECSITDGPHETPVFYDEGIPFISAEAVSCGNGKIDFTHMRGFISREYYDQCCEKYIPRRGDIYVIKSGATTGKAAIVDTDEVFTIWSPLAAIRCDKTKLLPSYVFRFVQSDAFQKQVEDGWTYGTQQNIGMRTLEKVLVCFPSLKEQQAIADYLDSKTAEIDSLIEKKKQLIEKLQEYRKSLISEAVTGKFKVPGV
ncbi:MAG: restriction endonuclease subunit S, partial [Anaerotardibacter sp.]